MRHAARGILLVFALALIATLSLSRLGEAQEPFSISGEAWVDADLDGQRDPDEAPMLRLDLGLEGTSFLARTDAAGRYSFDGVPSGRYRIRILGPSTVAITHPELSTTAGLLPLEIDVGPSATVDLGIVPQDRMLRLIGSAWVDGKPVAQAAVRGLIADSDCTVTSSLSIIPLHTDPGYYSLSVAPGGPVLPCGESGDVVTFSINGRPANETVAWSVEFRQLMLTAGPKFALLTDNQAHLVVDDGRLQRDLEARINGNPCSEIHTTFGGILLQVYSQELRAGCGVDGARVQIVVDGLTADQTIAWRHGQAPLGLDQLTFGGVYLRDLPGSASGLPGEEETLDEDEATGSVITPPDTGDAGLASPIECGSEGY